MANFVTETRYTGLRRLFRVATIRELLGKRPSVQELSIEDGSLSVSDFNARLLRRGDFDVR